MLILVNVKPAPHGTHSDNIPFLSIPDTRLKRLNDLAVGGLSSTIYVYRIS